MQRFYSFVWPSNSIKLFHCALTTWPRSLTVTLASSSVVEGARAGEIELGNDGKIIVGNQFNLPLLHGTAAIHCTNCFSRTNTNIFCSQWRKIIYLCITEVCHHDDAINNDR